MSKRVVLAAVAWGLAGIVSVAGGSPGDYFGIRVVDAETGEGVPLVELTTVHQVRYVTDSAGWAAIDEPGLAGEEVYFEVGSHGYEYPSDGFGNRGIRLTVEPGEREEIAVTRLNIAERLCRLTGEGIYRDTILLGLEAPTRRPLLNGGVVGQDSVHTAFYRDRLYWFWGDTGKLSYPLGNFHMSAATTPIPEKDDPPPDDGINFKYFIDDDGFSREMAPVPGDGPTWLSGIIALPDAGGTERLVGGYSKIRGMLETYERGVVIYDDATETFVKDREFPLERPLHPLGHAIKIDGDDFVYFASPAAVVRVGATVEEFLNPRAYEGYTPLREGSNWEERELVRDGDGRLVFAWKPDTPVLDAGKEAELIEDGLLGPEEAQFHFRDPDSGDLIRLHNGSVAWNDHRERWVLIASELRDGVQLTDVWYAEGDTPQGPWENPRRIVTHDRYTFYNPKHHPFFDRDGGRFLYFEGTYTKLFSGREEATPRYDYNQILYRLDLESERMRE